MPDPPIIGSLLGAYLLLDYFNRAYLKEGLIEGGASNYSCIRSC